MQKWSPRGVLSKKVFLEILQNSQENSSARASFLMKLQTEACNFIKKETLATDKILIKFFQNGNAAFAKVIVRNTVFS